MDEAPDSSLQALWDLQFEIQRARRTSLAPARGETASALLDEVRSLRESVKALIRVLMERMDVPRTRSIRGVCPSCGEEFAVTEEMIS